MREEESRKRRGGEGGRRGSVRGRVEGERREGGRRGSVRGRVEGERREGERRGSVRGREKEL